ncbi:MAG: hypothetical protein H7Y31_14300 [Chitinophagaceae bacterium]|nr:hypothetical protein [Chitinophagaceae bacterium]
MKKKCLKFLFAGMLSICCIADSAAQQSKLDSLFNNADSTAVLDSLMADFDNYLDSLSRRKNMFFVGVGIGTGFFSFDNNSSVYVNTEKKLMISPSIAYYHKTGFGISGAAVGLINENKFSFYQFSLTPSYDFINKAFSSGFAYTHYFNKDSLQFYTTPINDEVFAYVSYKKWWLRPTVNISYGWGSVTDYKEQQYRLLSRRLQQRGNYVVTVKNVESVRDLSLTLSLRKDFDWYDVIGKDDNITLTPVIMANAGTQQYGFNTSYSYTFNPVRINSVPGNNNGVDETAFAMQSAGAIIRATYMKGKFLVQPQVLFDYYLQPTESDPLNIVFSLNLSVAL